MKSVKIQLKKGEAEEIVVMSAPGGPSIAMEKNAIGEMLSIQVDGVEDVSIIEIDE